MFLLFSEVVIMMVFIILPVVGEMTANYIPNHGSRLLSSLQNMSSKLMMGF